MAVVYRYTDLHDEIIKYVGIVWSGNRTLADRIKEHSANDEWCKDGCWKIEYLEKNIKSRIDAELLEAHYISKFGTGEFFNKSKSTWGKSDLLDDLDENWIEYTVVGNTPVSDMISNYDKMCVSPDEDWIDENKPNLFDIRFDNNITGESDHYFIPYFCKIVLKENHNIQISDARLFYLWFVEEFVNKRKYEVGMLGDSSLAILAGLQPGGDYFDLECPIQILKSEIDGRLLKVTIDGLEIEVLKNGIFSISFNDIKNIMNTSEWYSYHPFDADENPIDTLDDLYNIFLHKK